MCLELGDYVGITIVVMLFSDTDKADANRIAKKVEKRINTND